MLGSAENLPFTVALLVMLFIALLEGLAVVFGVGISSTLDALLPDMHIEVDHLHVDSHQSGLARILGWMRVGEVPALIILIIGLTTFGLIGLSIQSTLYGLTGEMLPASFAWIPALLAALPITRVFTGIASRIVPKDETEAVSRDSFIGSVAIVTTGTAAADSPAQARVADQFGQSHYIMVAPVRREQFFEQGSRVQIVKREGANYLVDTPPEC